jgi:hypothetical protein
MGRSLWFDSAAMTATRQQLRLRGSCRALDPTALATSDQQLHMSKAKRSADATTHIKAQSTSLTHLVSSTNNQQQTLNSYRQMRLNNVDKGACARRRCKPLGVLVVGMAILVVRLLDQVHID